MDLTMLPGSGRVVGGDDYPHGEYKINLVAKSGDWPAVLRVTYWPDVGAPQVDPIYLCMICRSAVCSHIDAATGKATPEPEPDWAAEIVFSGWARWALYEEDGNIFEYEHRPRPEGGGGWWHGQVANAAGWRTSLRRVVDGKAVMP